MTTKIMIMIIIIMIMIITITITIIIVMVIICEMGANQGSVHLAHGHPWMAR